MADVLDIIRDETIANELSLKQAGLSEEEVIEALDASSGLVVGVPSDPDLRREHYRQCMSIHLSGVFGLPWTVGRLRVALKRVCENAYPET